MPRKQAKQRTVLQVLVDRVGLLHAGRVLSFVMAWLVAEAELGAEYEERGDDLDQLQRGLEGAQEVLRGERRPTFVLTVEQYAEFWGMSRAQAFKEQARFRRAFEPEGLEHPMDLLVLLNRGGMGDQVGIPLGLAVWPA